MKALLPGTPVIGADTRNGEIIHGIYLHSTGAHTTQTHRVATATTGLRQLVNLRLDEPAASRLAESLTPHDPCNGCEGCLSGDISPAQRILEKR